jgi:hypothetical protein
MPAKTKETAGVGFEKSMAQLRDIPLLPDKTVALVEETAATVGNTKVLAYGINKAIHTYFDCFGTRRMKYQEVLKNLIVSLENICALHSAELEVSAIHMEDALRQLGVIPAIKKSSSLLDLDPDTMSTAKDFVLVTSVWRKNGGRSTWKQDRRVLLSIAREHQHELDRACEAIRTTQSIRGPFVAVMDSLAVPLAAGAL